MRALDCVRKEERGGDPGGSGPSSGIMWSPVSTCVTDVTYDVISNLVASENNDNACTLLALNISPSHSLGNALSTACAQGLVL